MRADLLVQALTGVAAFAITVVLGMCMVLCDRSHFSDVSERVVSSYAAKTGLSVLADTVAAHEQCS
jgi:hypothetical protein